MNNLWTFVAVLFVEIIIVVFLCRLSAKRRARKIGDYGGE